MEGGRTNLNLVWHAVVPHYPVAAGTIVASCRCNVTRTASSGRSRRILTSKRPSRIRASSSLSSRLVAAIIMNPWVEVWVDCAHQRRGDVIELSVLLRLSRSLRPAARPRPHRSPRGRKAPACELPPARTRLVCFYLPHRSSESAVSEQNVLKVQPEFAPLSALR